MQQLVLLFLDYLRKKSSNSLCLLTLCNCSIWSLLSYDSFFPQILFLWIAVVKTPFHISCLSWQLCRLFFFLGEWFMCIISGSASATQGAYQSSGNTALECCTCDYCARVFERMGLAGRVYQSLKLALVPFSTSR